MQEREFDPPWREQQENHLPSLAPCPGPAPAQRPAPPPQVLPAAAAGAAIAGEHLGREERSEPVFLSRLEGAYVYEVSQMKHLWLFN